MKESKIIDRRDEPKPEKPMLHIYPTCRTCKYFDNFIMADGRASAETICVIDPPKSFAQIRGEDAEGRVLWAVWAGWPPVMPVQRCGRHAARDAN